MKASVAAATLVILICGCNDSGKQMVPIDERTEAYTIIKRLGKSDYIPADAVHMHYTANALSGAKYFEKWPMPICGSVKQVGRDVAGNPFVLLKISKPLGGVKLTFSPKDAEHLAKLRTGQPIYVAGQSQGMILGVVVFTDSRMMSPAG